MSHNTFCLVCRVRFPTNNIINAKLFKTKNNRTILKGFCPVCNNGVARMISNRDLQSGIQGSGVIGAFIDLIPDLKGIGKILRKLKK